MLPKQANDIAVISLTARSMQDMIFICEQHSLNWSFTFSLYKSQIINFCRATNSRFFLFNMEVHSINAIKHVSITLNKNLNSSDRTLNACKAIKSVTDTIAIRVSHIWNKPECKHKTN